MQSNSFMNVSVYLNLKIFQVFLFYIFCIHIKIPE